MSLRKLWKRGCTLRVRAACFALSPANLPYQENDDDTPEISVRRP